MNSESESTTSGRRTVTFMALTALAIAAVFGYLIGIAIPNDAKNVGVLSVSVQPTPFNMAVYGIGAVLLVGSAIYLLLRVTVRYDSNSIH